MHNPKYRYYLLVKILGALYKRNATKNGANKCQLHVAILLSVNDIFYVQILAHICNAINFYFACRMEGGPGEAVEGVANC